MAKGFKRGAGGSIPFNFKIVAYATDELLMAAMPKENTMGIITDKKITGYHFSPTQPAKMEEGEVWFGVGTSSQTAFNALKKNTIMVFPNFAKQYVSGELVEVVAKTYQGGKWVDWTTYLYRNGDECVPITGGWITTVMRNSGNYGNTDVVTVEKNADNFTLTGTRVAGGKLLHPVNKINLSSVKTLTFNCTSASTGDCSVIVGVWSELGTTSAYVAPVASVENPNGVVALDVLALTGEYYIGVFVSSWSTGDVTATLHEVSY